MRCGKSLPKLQPIHPEYTHKPYHVSEDTVPRRRPSEFLFLLLQHTDYICCICSASEGNNELTTAHQMTPLRSSPECPICFLVSCSGMKVQSFTQQRGKLNSIGTEEEYSACVFSYVWVFVCQSCSAEVKTGHECYL